MQRERNALRDSDAAIRRETLESLASSKANDRLTSDAAPAIASAAAGCLLDSSESNRSLSLQALNNLARSGHPEEVLSALTEHSVKLAQKEPSEEVRLACVTLCEQLCHHAHASTSADPLADTALAFMHDRFPDAAKAGTRLATSLARAHHALISSSHTHQLADASLRMLSHKHSNARVLAIELVSALSESECVTNAARKVPLDRSAKVRREGYIAIGSWLAQGVGHQGVHLASLCKGLADEGDELVSVASNSVSTVLTDDDISNNEGSSELAESAATILCDECASWAREGKPLAAKALVQLLETFGGACVAGIADTVVSTLASLLSSGNNDLAHPPAKAARVIGKSVSFDSLVPILSSRVDRATRSDPNLSACELSLVTFVLHGSTEQQHHQNQELIQPLAESLASLKLRSPEAPALNPYTAAALAALARKVASSSLQSPDVPLILIPPLLHLAELETTASASNHASSALHEHSQGALRVTKNVAYRLLETLQESASSWDSQSSPGLFILGGLLRHVQPPEDVKELVEHVLSVYERALSSDIASESPELQAALVRQLDALAEDNRGCGTSDALISRGDRVVSSILLPSMRWRAGKASARVRYQACVALGTLLRGGSDAAAAAVRAHSQGISTILSCLEEDQAADTRRASCHIIENLLLLNGYQLSEEERRLVYPALLRRMDDAKPEIRINAAAAIGSFIQTMGYQYCDTNARYLFEGFLVHMDDPNEQLRTEVQSSLATAVPMKPSLLKAVLQSARTKHRSPQLCDELIAQCDEMMARDK